MGAEKRSLKRVSNRYGIEFQALLYGSDGKTTPALIVDFNALGVSIKALDAGNPLELQQIEKIELKYGKEVICSVYNPEVIRSVDTEKFIVSFKSEKTEFASRSERLPLGFSFQAVLSGLDPLTVDHILYFRVVQISQNGFKIASSKSNHHLIPGMEFQDFKMTIPGQKDQKISFKISNVTEQDGQLYFGCRILQKPKSFDATYRKLRIASTDLSSRSGEELEEIKKDIRKIKKFIGQLRVTTVKTQLEYEKVLDLRYRAYKAAQKVSDDQTTSDMGDPYDEHAIILTAYVGINLVGTMRIVMAEPGKSLPLEEKFDLSTIKKINQAESSEVSRFAIDPIFQGTDLFIAISRKLVWELVAKKIKYPLCISTQKLAPSYKALGAVQIAPPIPHPSILSETLTLYWLVPQKVFEGKTGSLSWIFVIKPSLKLLKRWGLIEKTSHGWGHYLKMWFEVVSMKLKRRRK